MCAREVIMEIIIQWVPIINTNILLKKKQFTEFKLWKWSVCRPSKNVMPHKYMWPERATFPSSPFLYFSQWNAACLIVRTRGWMPTRLSVIEGPMCYCFHTTKGNQWRTIYSLIYPLKEANGSLLNTFGFGTEILVEPKKIIVFEHHQNKWHLYKCECTHKPHAMKVWEAYSRWCFIEVWGRLAVVTMGKCSFH